MRTFRSLTCSREIEDEVGDAGGDEEDQNCMIVGKTLAWEDRRK